MNDRSSEKTFQLTLFRGFGLYCRDQVVVINQQKARALLAYLVMQGTGFERRSMICSLLWSETSEERARGSLRQLTRAIKQTLDEIVPEVLTTTRHDLRLSLDHFDADLLKVQRELDEGRVPTLLLEVKQIGETLLAGYEDCDPEFRIWLLVQRQTINEQLMQRLWDMLDAADAASGSADAEYVERICRALLNLDATNERACRRLMRMCSQRGDKVGALRVYEQLEEVLGDDYGIEPSAETRKLAAAIKTGIAVAAEPAAVPAQRLVLLIERFTFDGISEDKSHIATGFRHELISTLVKFRDWRILDYDQQSHVDGDEAVVYTISANIYQKNDVLAVSLTLQETDSATYVWSDRFELRLDEWFDVQEMIVRRTAAALNVNLSEARLAKNMYRPDVSLDMYDRWLLGKSLIQSFQPENHERALVIFRSLIAASPTFVYARLGLVQYENCRHLVNPGVMRNPQRLAEALDTAKQVQQMDPLNAQAHLHLAWSYAMNNQFKLAAFNFSYAFNLNNIDSWILTSAAAGLAFCGEKARALACANEALALDPNPSPVQWGYQAITRFICEDYAASLNAAEYADNAFHVLPVWKAAALYWLDREAEAKAEVARMIHRLHALWRDGQPTEAAIGRWALQCFPISQLEDWQRLRDALSGTDLSLPEHPGYLAMVN